MLAQRRQDAGRSLAGPLCGERGHGEVADLALNAVEPLGRGVELGGRLEPAQMQHHRVGAADMVGEPAVAARLSGLLLQCFELLFLGPDDVVEAG